MYCDIQMQHTLLLKHCICVMRKLLCFNICDHPSSFVFDKDVDGLAERVKERITQGLSYACRFWGSHLNQCQDNAVVRDMWMFLQEKFLFWIEAMNLIEKVADCGKVLADVQHWCKVICKQVDYRCNCLPKPITLTGKWPRIPRYCTLLE